MKPEIPLKAFSDDENFKIYLNDVGILNRISEVGIRKIMEGTPFMFRGAITENYVATELYFHGIPLLFWKSKGVAEIDFLISSDDGIIPIEVKANERVQSKSLKYYMEKFNPKYGIRISAKNFGFENEIFSIPLYAVFCIERQK